MCRVGTPSSLPSGYVNLIPKYTEKIGVNMQHTLGSCSHSFNLHYSKFLIKNSMIKEINSSLWLLTCWTDNVILYQSDHSPGKSQWPRVVTHRCRQHRIPSKQHSSLCTVTTVPSLPAQWRNDCDYADSKSPTKHTISIYCKRECCALSFGMEAFKKREEHYCGGGELRKLPCYISAQGCSGGVEKEVETGTSYLFFSM